MSCRTTVVGVALGLLFSACGNSSNGGGAEDASAGGVSAAQGGTSIEAEGGKVGNGGSVGRGGVVSTGGAAEAGGATGLGGVTGLGGAASGGIESTVGGDTGEAGTTSEAGTTGMGGATSAAGSSGATSEGGTGDEGGASGGGGEPESGGSSGDAGSAGAEAGAAGSTECPLLVGPYFVSTTGSDENPGTQELPFRTIQRAAEVVGPGDVVEVAGGIYRETVTMRTSGTEEAPIRFQAADGEVVVVSGANYLNVSWEEAGEGIWVASVIAPVTQLFVNGQAMVDARFPNAVPDHLVDAPRAHAGVGTTPQTLVDEELPDGDLTGAYVNAVAGSGWYSYTRQIAEYDPVSRTAMLDAPLEDPNPELPLQFEPEDEYFVYGSLALLDSEGEWFYDPIESRLYLMPPGGTDPNQLEIESRARALGFDLGPRSHLVLAGFRVFSAGFGGARSSYVTVDGVHVRYPVHQLFTDGQSLPDAGSVRLGTASSFQNGSVTQSSHSGLAVVGSDNVIQNSVFTDVAYSAAVSAGIHTLHTTTGNVLTRNTIRRSGSSGIRFHGLTEGELSFNDVSEVCISVPDCGAMYAAYTNGAGTELHHNVVAAPPGQDLSSGIYLDDVTEGFVVHHNLVLSQGFTGIMIKGPSDVFNNTILPGGRAPIAYMKAPPWTVAEENTDLSSISVANNLLSQVPGLFVQFVQGASDSSPEGRFQTLIQGSVESQSHEVAIDSLVQASHEHPRAVFDKSALSELVFTPASLDGAFEMWLDDIVLVTDDGLNEFVIDRFTDSDTESDLAGTYWWGGAGEEASATTTVEVDPTTGSRALHLNGEMVPGGWAAATLSVTGLDLTQYSTLRFSVRTGGEFRISSPDGDPTLAANADCPVEDDYVPTTDCAIDQGIVAEPITDGFLGTAPDLGAFESGGELWTAGALEAEPDWTGLPSPGDYPETEPVSEIAYTAEIVDDFEDGDLGSSHVLFAGWWLALSEDSTVIPEPLATSDGGAGGSNYALGLTGTAGTYAQIGLGTRANGDLSSYAGIRFRARGSGWLWVSVRMTEMLAASDYNTHGKSFALTEEWQSFELRLRRQLPIPALRRFFGSLRSVGHRLHHVPVARHHRRLCYRRRSVADGP